MNQSLMHYPYEVNSTPLVPGEYPIRDSRGDIAYIGIAHDPAHRTQEHMCSVQLTPESGEGAVG